MYAVCTGNSTKCDCEQCPSSSHLQAFQLFKPLPEYNYGDKPKQQLAHFAVNTLGQHKLLNSNLAQPKTVKLHLLVHKIIMVQPNGTEQDRSLRFFVTGLKVYGDQTISCSCHLVPFAVCDEWRVCWLSGSNMGLLQYTFAFETHNIIIIP